MVHHWEQQANQYGEELKQLDSTIKEEGLFCAEWCVVVSEYVYHCVGSLSTTSWHVISYDTPLYPLLQCTLIGYCTHKTVILLSQ